MTTPAIQPLAPIDWSQLLATGRATLIPQPPATQPDPAAVRRAISTAYYAAFHALSANNAEVLVGAASDQLTADARIQIYRGLNHNQARVQLQQNRARLSVDAQVFAKLFADLQDERHSADYNPVATFTAEAATNWLDKTEASITNFLQTSRSERAAIAALTLIRTR